MLSAAEVIAALELKPLPREGGYYCETYRNADLVHAGALPSRYGRDKSISTAIYYLLTPDTFSAMHRLPTDEVFHFYLGDPVTMLQLGPDGGHVLTLGPDLRAGQQVQTVVPCGVWFGSFLSDGGSWALMGTTMAPAFDFTDYEAGDRTALCDQWPQWAEMIRRLTRE
jgi:predicted cupin superfamily sugar epimerase